MANLKTEMLNSREGTVVESIRKRSSKDERFEFDVSGNMRMCGANPFPVKALSVSTTRLSPQQEVSGRSVSKAVAVASQVVRFDVTAVLAAQVFRDA